MAFERSFALRTLRTRNLSRFLSFMTAVAVGSVAVGTAALIITFTILDGFERELRGNIIALSSHIQAATFRQVSTAHDTARQEAMLRVPHVTQAMPFLQRQAVVITRDNLDGIVVKGIPAAQASSFLSRNIVAGRAVLASDGSSSCIMGRRLAGKLGLGVGDRVVLLGVTSFADIASAPKVQCTIRGLYETGMAEYFDDVYVFTDLGVAQRLFAEPGAINGYDVRVDDVAQIDATVARLQKDVGYPFDPRSVYDIYRPIFVWIDLQKQLIPIVVGSLILIAAFNIIATLLLFVIEKTRTVGVLRAMGASRASIRRIFMLQGLTIGLTGAAFGSAIAFVFCFAQQELRFFSLPQDVYFMSTVPIDMSAAVFALVSFAAVALTFLASIVPAWLGARLDPIRSIRFH
jgi:lipoprotein-releasing system permease protein